jgi:4-carboxymuconolactone decarboxylase
MKQQYPDDIDPVSGCRLPLPRREELSPETQAIYDRLTTTGGENLRGLRGPGGIQLHSPELSRRSRPVNQYLRFEAGLGGRVRELAILATACELDSQFEWAAHEDEAQRQGISAELIDTIRYRRALDGVAEPDAMVITLARELFGARKVSSATYACCLAHFGRRMLVDLVALMGNYAATAALLTAFDMQLDPGTEPGLPSLP